MPFRRGGGWRAGSGPRVWDIVSPGAEFPVRVIRVVDGDSLFADYLGEDRRRLGVLTFEIRLFGIDAPELRRGLRPAQRGADEATSYLRSIALGREFTFRYFRRLDRRSRFLPWSEPRLLGILLRGRGRITVNREMLREGWAHCWVYEKARCLDIPPPGVLNGAGESQRDARENRRGIWAYPPEDRVLPDHYRNPRRRPSCRCRASG